MAATINHVHAGIAAGNNDITSCPSQTLFQYNCPCCSAPPGLCSNLNMESRAAAKRRDARRNGQLVSANCDTASSERVRGSGCRKRLVVRVRSGWGFND